MHFGGGQTGMIVLGLLGAGESGVGVEAVGDGARFNTSCWIEDTVLLQGLRRPP